MHEKDILRFDITVKDKQGVKFGEVSERQDDHLIELNGVHKVFLEEVLHDVDQHAPPSVIFQAVVSREDEEASVKRDVVERRSFLQEHFKHDDQLALVDTVKDRGETLGLV